MTFNNYECEILKQINFKYVQDVFRLILNTHRRFHD